MDRQTCRVRRLFTPRTPQGTLNNMPFRPANLVHTDEAALAESTTSPVGSGSTEPRPLSSAVERRVHIADVVGSIPTVATIRPQSKRANYVYFVQARVLRLVKIGIATCYNSRISNHRSSSPDQLDLLGLIRPDGLDPRRLEEELHGHFSHLRSHGEWFHPGDDLMAYIAAHAISEARNQFELAHQAMMKLERRQGPMPRWTPEMEAHYAEPMGLPPVHPARPLVDPRRPVTPVGAPTGNGRKARMERYLAARGLSA